MELHTD